MKLRANLNGDRYTARNVKDAMRILCRATDDPHAKLEHRDDVWSLECGRCGCSGFGRTRWEAIANVAHNLSNRAGNNCDNFTVTR